MIGPPSFISERTSSPPQSAAHLTRLHPNRAPGQSARHEKGRPPPSNAWEGARLRCYHRTNDQTLSAERRMGISLKGPRSSESEGNYAQMGRFSWNFSILKDHPFNPPPNHTPLQPPHPSQITGWQLLMDGGLGGSEGDCYQMRACGLSADSQFQGSDGGPPSAPPTSLPVMVNVRDPTHTHTPRQKNIMFFKHSQIINP